MLACADCEWSLRLLRLAFGSFLDAHILELAGFEDFATLEAFHKLRVFFAAHDLHARMLAGLLGGVLGLRERL